MKNHLKRIASPRSWAVIRKINSGKYIMRPNAGGHSLEKSLPLGLILRDILGLADTTNEVKKLINNNDVLIDGKIRKDYQFMVGLFDVIALPKVNKYYRVSLDSKCRIIIPEISNSESAIKICKVIRKTMLSNGKLQLCLHDGKCLISSQPVKVGDSVVVGLPKLEIKEVLHLKPQALVFLTQGKHGGEIGTLKEIKGQEAIYNVEGKDVETAKDYLFVVGDKKPVIKIQ